MRNACSPLRKGMQPLVIGVIAVVGLAGPAHPQAVARSSLWIGLSGNLTFPLGEYGQHVGKTFGGGAAFVVRLGASRKIGLRAEASNWSERETRPIGTCLPCALVGGFAYAEIRHAVSTIGVGPELNVPIGPARLGINPQVGFSTFQTVVSMQEVFFFFIPADARRLGKRTTTKAWAGGGANVALPVARWRRHPVWAEIGLRYLHHGQISYVTPAGVTLNADGSLSFSPTASAVNLMQVRAGILAGLRRE